MKSKNIEKLKQEWTAKLKTATWIWINADAEWGVRAPSYEKFIDSGAENNYGIVVECKGKRYYFGEPVKIEDVKR